MCPDITTKVPDDVADLTPSWAWIMIQQQMSKDRNYKPSEGLPPAGKEAKQDSSEPRIFDSFELEQSNPDQQTCSNG